MAEKPSREELIQQLAEKGITFDIPDDMLESLSGGVLDEVSYNNLKGIVVLCKQSGMSLEATLGALSYLQHTSDGDEINDLIHEFYNA